MKLKSIIYLLLNYINGAIEEDTYLSIARTLLLNLEKVRELSLEDTAILCNCSYSTINRFCKKIGFANYSTFREIIRVQDDHLLPISKQLQIDELFEYIDHYDFTNYNSLLDQAKRIILIGYGEFEYPSLYYQKQMISLHKLIEVYNVYIDNFDFSQLTNDDLVIFVSMTGEFFKPNPRRIEQYHFKKILITQNPSLTNFDYIILLPVVEEGINKYLLLRLYENMIESMQMMKSF